MKKSVNKASERKAAYFFVIPAVALLAAFLIYPSLQTVRYAFTDYNIMRPDRIVFCGFNNFAELFQDEDFWIAVKNTIYFTVLVVPFQTVLALSLALLISSRRRGVSVFRASIFQPSGNLHGSCGNPLDRNVQYQPGQRPVKRPAGETGTGALWISERSEDSDEFHYFHVCMAGSGIPDDDFSGRPAGNFQRAV